MDRRAFLETLAGSVLAGPLGAETLQAGKRRLIGYLVTGSLESPEARVLRDAFRQGLRERGHVEGQTIVIEYSGADGHIEWFPRLAEELVRLKPDVIVAANTLAGQAVREATTTIPIVVPVMVIRSVMDSWPASRGQPETSPG
jgi:ABC-type uncharacterized transport system substrate-binding protein